MKTVHNYKPYTSPKKALYFQLGEEYVNDINTGFLGWKREEREAIVIGEDDTTYITSLKEYRVSDTSDPYYGQTVLLPMGFHKSYLVKWIPLYGEQLSLF